MASTVERVLASMSTTEQRKICKSHHIESWSNSSSEGSSDEEEPEFDKDMYEACQPPPVQWSEEYKAEIRRQQYGDFDCTSEELMQDIANQSYAEILASTTEKPDIQSDFTAFCRELEHTNSKRLAAKSDRKNSTLVKKASTLQAPPPTPNPSAEVLDSPVQSATKKRSRRKQRGVKKKASSESPISDDLLPCSLQSSSTEEVGTKSGTEYVLPLSPVSDRECQFVEMAKNAWEDVAAEYHERKQVMASATRARTPTSSTHSSNSAESVLTATKLDSGDIGKTWRSSAKTPRYKGAARDDFLNDVTSGPVAVSDLKLSKRKSKKSKASAKGSTNVENTKKPPSENCAGLQKNIRCVAVEKNKSKSKMHYTVKCAGPNKSPADEKVLSLKDESLLNLVMKHEVPNFDGLFPAVANVPIAKVMKVPKTDQSTTADTGDDPAKSVFTLVTKSRKSEKPRCVSSSPEKTVTNFYAALSNPNDVSEEVPEVDKARVDDDKHTAKDKKKRKNQRKPSQASAVQNGAKHPYNKHFDLLETEDHYVLLPKVGKKRPKDHDGIATRLSFEATARQALRCTPEHADRQAATIVTAPSAASRTCMCNRRRQRGRRRQRKRQPQPPAQATRFDAAIERAFVCCRLLFPRGSWLMRALLASATLYASVFLIKLQLFFRA